MHKPRVSGSGVDGTDGYGVAIEANVNAWLEHFLPTELTPFDSFNSRRSYIEVFAEGTRPIDFTIEADGAWTKVTQGPSQRLDRCFSRFVPDRGFHRCRIRRSGPPV